MVESGSSPAGRADPLGSRGWVPHDPDVLATLARVVATADDAVYSERLDGTIMSWNRGAERLFGYSTEYAVGRRGDWLFDHEMLGELNFLRRRVHAGEDVEKIEFECVRQDGLIVPVMVTANPIRPNGEAVVGVWITARDATEQRTAQETLADSAARLEEAQALAHIGIWAWDSVSDAVELSGELHRICGLGPLQFDGTFDNYAALVHPSDRPSVVAAMRRASSLGRSFEQEYRIVRPDGEVRWVYGRGERAADPSGRATGMRGITQDITERKSAEGELKRQAAHDALTGLPNRSLFLTRLDEALAAVEHRGSNVAVLFVDLDNFKVVNDSLGHAAGDAVLVALAQRIQSVLKPTDTVARFGGDEFTIVCRDLKSEDDVLGVVNRVSEAVAQPLALEVGGELVITCSIGIAFGGGRGDGAEVLLRDADVAMYRAKQQGRARHEVFNEAMHTGAMQRLNTVRDLRHAITHDELRLFYQPQFSLVDGRLTGAEALVRWQRSDGLAYPDEFIQLAEESQLIVPIGNWVLAEACRQAVRWASAGRFKMAVNVSACQLARPDLVQIVADTLRETGAEPRSICLEITESVLMGDADFYLDALTGLRKLGVSIAVDDFGMGYSSLAYLQRFPVDVLKVDRAFVSGLGQGDAQSRAIVGAVIDLAHALEMTSVAEGVETDGQRVDLIDLGCDIGQGYFFGRPEAVDGGAEWHPNARHLEARSLR